MAQNERQGIGTEKAGTKTGAEGTGPVAASRATAAQGGETTGEQGRVDVGSQGTGTGRDPASPADGSRGARAGTIRSAASSAAAPSRCSAG